MIICQLSKKINEKQGLITISNTYLILALALQPNNVISGIEEDYIDDHNDNGHFRLHLVLFHRAPNVFESWKVCSEQ